MGFGETRVTWATTDLTDLTLILGGIVTYMEQRSSKYEVRYQDQQSGFNARAVLVSLLILLCAQASPALAGRLLALAATIGLLERVVGACMAAAHTPWSPVALPADPYRRPPHNSRNIPS